MTDQLPADVRVPETEVDDERIALGNGPHGPGR